MKFALRRTFAAFCFVPAGGTRYGTGTGNGNGTGTGNQFASTGKMVHAADQPRRIVCTYTEAETELE